MEFVRELDCKEDGFNAKYLLYVSKGRGDRRFFWYASHLLRDSRRGVGKVRRGSRFQAAYVVAMIPRSNTGPFAALPMRAV